MLSLFTSSGTVVTPQLTDAIHNTLSDLLQLILLAVSTGAGLLIKRYLNSMGTGLKRTIATRLVKFAEQRLVGNDQKLNYVTQELSKALPRLSTEEIHHLAEEAVYNLQATSDPNADATVVVSPQSPTPPAIPLLPKP